jgi:hypothetical protein
MILIVCRSCSFTLRVIEGHEDVVVEPALHKCPSCTGEVRTTPEAGVTAEDFARLRVHDVTWPEAFVALSGVGMPTERECTVDKVRALFTQSISSVGLEPVHGTGRSILTHLEFADGTKLYLGASPFGAVAYRLVLPTRHSQGVE